MQARRSLREQDEFIGEFIILAVEKNDRYVNIGKLGVQYASDSEHYFFLDVLPWCKFSCTVKNVVLTTNCVCHSEAHSRMVSLGEISPSGQRGEESFLHDAI